MFEEIPGLISAFNLLFQPWHLECLSRYISLVIRGTSPFQAEGHKLYKDLKNFLSAVKGEYQGAQGDPDGVYAATKKSGG